MTYSEMLEQLTRRGGSERRAAALFGISQTAFNNWCRRRALPDDEQARRIAELLKLDPAYVLAVIHGERAKSKETRATWRRMAEVFGKAAALAAIAIAPAFTSPDARAGFNTSQNAPTSGGACSAKLLNTQCPTRRRRTAPHFADTLLQTLGLSAQQPAL